MSWHCTETLQEPFAIDRIAISSDGEILASAGYGALSIWHLPSRQRLHTLITHDDEIQGIDLTSNGHFLVSASASEPTSCGVVKVWDTKTGQELSTWNEKTCASIAISIHPNGTILATGTDDYYGMPAVNLWSLDNFQSLGKLCNCSGSIHSISFSSDGKAIAVASGCDVQYRNFEMGESLHIFPEHQDIVEQVIFGANDTELISCSSMDQTIRLLNVKLGQQNYVFHHAASSSVALDPERGELASDSKQNIQLWNMMTREVICTLSGHNSLVTSVLFSPTKELISGSLDCSIKIWTRR